MSFLDNIYKTKMCFRHVKAMSRELTVNWIEILIEGLD
jgi:hypothetical protein